MERYRSLRTVIVMLAVLLAFELGLITVMVWPADGFMLLSLATMAIVALYLIFLSWGLLKELMDKEKNS